MKRILPLILTVLLLPALLVVPARADESVLGLNLLEVATPNDSSSYTTKHTETSSGDIWHLPFETNVNYIDMVVRVTGGDLREVVVSADSGFGSYSLNFVYIQSGLIRIFGSLGGQETDYLRIKFNYDSSSGSSFFVTYRQFTIDSKPYVIHEILTHGYLDDFGNDRSDVMSYEGYAREYAMPASSSFLESFLASWIFEPDDWLKYDFIEVAFSSASQGFTGIGATLGLETLVVPVEYNVVSQASTEYRDSVYVASVRIDLRNIDRVKYSDSTLSLRISGGKTYNQPNSFSIQSIKGFVYSEQPTGIAALFINLKDWIFELGNQIVRSINFAYIRVVEAIDALPDKIADSFASVFVPSESALNDFAESSQQIAQDRFGGVYEGAMIVDQFAGQLHAQTATQILTVPVVNLDILGVPFPLGGWEVDLVPEGSELIIEAVKLIIDIIATLTFVNGIKSRLERTLEQ